MKKEFKGIQRKGLPGGPHEQFTYVTGVFMQDMYHVPEAQKGIEVELDNTKTQRPVVIEPVYTLPEITVYPNMDAFGRQLPEISKAKPFDYSRYLSHPHELLPRNLAENPIIDLVNEVYNPFNWISDIDKGVNNLVDGNFKQGALQIVDGTPLGNPYKIFKAGLKGPKNLLPNILKQVGVEQLENEAIEEDEKIDLIHLLDVSKQKGGEGYRLGEEGYNDPYKIIPSGNITMTEKDGSPLEKGPMLGIDDLGNQQMMYPGYDYRFPGSKVTEIPMVQRGNGESNLTPQQLSMMKNAIARNTNIPFVKRLTLTQKDSPSLYLGKDEQGYDMYGSHQLGSYGNYVLPNIIQDGTSLKQISQKGDSNEIYRYHQGNKFKDALYFADPQDAIIFGEHYRKVSPAFQKMQDGGFFDKYVVGPLTGRPLRESLRKRLYESVTPIAYDPLHAAKEFAAGKRLPFNWNNYTTSYEEFDEHPMFMDPVRGRNPLGEYTKMTSDDTWNYLLNREQKYNTIRPSKYKPSINTGEDIETMSFVEDRDIFEEAERLGIFDKNIGDTLKVSDSSAGGFALDNYTLSKGRDSRGNYISYYDRYDINPKLLGMGIPVSKMVGKGEYDLYGRMYYNPATRERIYPETQITNLPETIRKRVQNVGIEEDGTIYTPFALPTSTVTADVKQEGGALPKYQTKGETYDINKIANAINKGQANTLSSDELAYYKKNYAQGNIASMQDENLYGFLPEATVYADPIKTKDQITQTLTDLGKLASVSAAAGTGVGLAAPFVAPPLMAALSNPLVQAGLTGYGIYDATTNSIPAAYNALKEGRLLDATGNASMAALDLLPIPFFGTNLLDEANQFKNFITKTPSAATALNTKKAVNNVNKTLQPFWSLQDLPGLHLKSTIKDGPISKIVEPKTGLINTAQALAIISKEANGKQKVELIKKVLGDNIPKKIDFNDFRKITQDQLIPLERQLITQKSHYGRESLGYLKDGNRSSWEYFIEDLGKGQLKNNNPELYQKTLKKLQDEYEKLPIENQTLLLSNKSKFGRGSSAHGNPDETLAHIHFLRDAETPDVLTVTQIQSDAFQGTHRVMPNNSKIKQWENMLTPEKRKELVEIGGEEAADLLQEGAQEFLEKEVKKAEEALGPNPTQKQLLDKKHQERFLQEFVAYAAERGDINKVRLPTSETAAKVQGYKKRVTGASEDWSGPMSNKGKIFEEYEPEHKTILKKYSKQPKLIKKLFGKEPKIVTDNKGNSWYEFEIPKQFKANSGEIIAFNTGGSTAKKQLNSDLLKTYKNYINGVDESAEAVKAYDKLNRIFYKESKLNNMSAPNYIMTHIIANA